MSYLFNGDDAFYTGTLPFSSCPANGITLVVWFKVAAAPGGTDTLLMIGNTVNSNNFYTLNLNTSLNVVATNDADSVGDSNPLGTVSTNTWSMAAAVFTDDGGSNTSRRAYLNGTLDTNDTTLTSTVWTNIAANGRISIGGTAAFAQDFDGYIAHAQIYDKALSEAELDTLYAGTNPVAAATETNLVAYWPLVSDYVTERGGTLSLSNTPVLQASDNPTVDDPPSSGSPLILPHRSSGGMIDLSGNFRG